MQIILILISFLLMPHLGHTASKLKNDQLVAGCVVFDGDGVVIEGFPGQMCIFFENGSFIAANEKAIRFFNRLDEVVWEIKGNFHHQLNLSEDGERILAMGSIAFSHDKKMFQSDSFLVIDLNGKILHQQDARAILDSTHKDWLGWELPAWKLEVSPASFEISHFNSFYEIPTIPKDKETSVFKKGNYIINGLAQGIFILSPDLQEVLFSSFLSPSFGHYVHDVQVNKKGHLVFFNNLSKGSDFIHAFSSILEYDLQNEEVVYEFTAQPKHMFYSQACGGVQELDEDRILFSDHLVGVYILSRSKNEITQSFRTIHFRNGVNEPVQQVRQMDLRSFLVSRDLLEF
jgi:hypothetical protein